MSCLLDEDLKSIFDVEPIYEADAYLGKIINVELTGCKVRGSIFACKGCVNDDTDNV